MNNRSLASGVGFCLLWVGAFSQSDEGPPHSRASAYGALWRGDPLTSDQLQIVASDAGISPAQISQMKLRDRFALLARRLKLPLEIAGFSESMLSDEEFRLFKGRRPGWGALMLNAGFWSKGAGRYDGDRFMAYLLFRAEAYYLYRSHYDADHCAWLVEEMSPSMQVLRQALAGSASEWWVDAGVPTGRDLEFRQSVDPSQDPSRTLKALTEYALRSVAQKAADNWALHRYHMRYGAPEPLIAEHVRERERALAWDFNRARSAMTRAERLAFQKLLQSPFHYVRPAAQLSQATYDPPLQNR
jgi:hypothetical protein